MIKKWLATTKNFVYNKMFAQILSRVFLAMVHTWCSGSTTVFQAAGPSSILDVCIICHTRIVNSLYFVVLNLYEPAQG